MLPEQRRYEILSVVKRRGAVSVNDLCELFSITPTTARKDLAELGQRGSIIRTHGGALNPGYARGHDVSLETRQNLQSREKTSIAEAAVAHVRPGDTILLDDSSTVSYLARLLKDMQSLTVVTYALDVVNVLSTAPGIRLMVIGGAFDAESKAFAGGPAEDMLSQLHVDKAFFSPKGVSLDAGLTDARMDQARLHRRVIASAAERVLMVDSSKFDVVCFAEVAPLDVVQLIITEREPSQRYVTLWEKRGVQLEIARGPARPGTGVAG